MSSRISYSHKLYNTIIRNEQSIFLFFLPSYFSSSVSLSFSPNPLPQPSPPTLSPNHPPLRPFLHPFICHSLPSPTSFPIHLSHYLSNIPPFPSLSTPMCMTVAWGSSVYSHRDQINLIDNLPKINHLLLLYLSSPPQSVYPGGVVVVGLWGSWYPPSSLLPAGKNY